MALMAVLSAWSTPSDGPSRAAQLITGKSWQDDDIVRLLQPHIRKTEIPDNVMQNLKDSFATFSPFGFHFMFPHYAKFALRNPDSELADNFIYVLSIVDPSREYWSQRLAKFSASEKQLVCRVVTFLSHSNVIATKKSREDAVFLWCNSAHSN